MTHALASRNPHHRRAGLARRWARRLWVAVERMLGSGNTCDRCDHAMLDYRVCGGERLCIQCVEERARMLCPIASPELAGCAAVLRAVLLELEELSSSETSAAWERKRIHELVQTSLGVVWWITPPNLRVPGELVIDEARVRALLTAYEAKWGRATGLRTLTGTFELWREMQLKAAKYRELADVDRRFAALREQSGPRASVPAARDASRGAA